MKVYFTQIQEFKKKLFSYIYFLNLIFLILSSTLDKNSTKRVITPNTIIFPDLSKNRDVIPNKKLREKISTNI